MHTGIYICISAYSVIGSLSGYDLSRGDFQSNEKERL